MAMEIEQNLEQIQQPVQSTDQVLIGTFEVKRTEEGGFISSRYFLRGDHNNRMIRLEPFDVLGEPIDLSHLTSCEDESPRVVVRKSRIPGLRSLAITSIELI